MPTVLIRVDAEMSEELTSAFPQLTMRQHPVTTTLTGQVIDQQELEGVLKLIRGLGIDVVEVLTIPD